MLSPTEMDQGQELQILPQWVWLPEASDFLLPASLPLHPTDSELSPCLFHSRWAHKKSFCEATNDLSLACSFLFRVRAIISWEELLQSPSNNYVLKLLMKMCYIGLSIVEIVGCWDRKAETCQKEENWHYFCQRG